ncbi:hypothetical protein DL98DRAFT_588900 [Cadophora sp. DSE1049]|nr:hypothetical protein DL98DRAFT_588900 [Cadophora sp. DSE1049]
MLFREGFENLPADILFSTKLCRYANEKLLSIRRPVRNGASSLNHWRMQPDHGPSKKAFIVQPKAAMLKLSSSCASICTFRTILDWIPFTSSAVEGGSIKTIEILLGLGAELYYFALCDAASHGHLPLVNTLYPGVQWMSPKIMPVRHRYASRRRRGTQTSCGCYLRHGADYEVEDDRVSTALELATHYRHDDVINILAARYRYLDDYLYD